MYDKVARNLKFDEFRKTCIDPKFLFFFFIKNLSRIRGNFKFHFIKLKINVIFITSFNLLYKKIRNPREDIKKVF